jgi:hypothetical protein
MFAALSVAPATTDIFTVPFLATLALSVVALVGIAVYLRRLRTTGRLTAASGSVGAASAALVLAVSLLVTVSIGPAAPAVAQDSTTATETVEPAAPVYQPIDIDALEGFQLPTK